jgi:hypothetical protein
MAKKLQSRQHRRKNAASKRRRSAHSYDFDVALSVADEDRLHAEALAQHLKSRGYRVFYDCDYRAHLWGKSRDEFERIYGPRSRYMIPLISTHYATNDWTIFEFESTKREEKQRGHEFILPVRIDDSRMLGLHDDRIYLTLSDQSIDEIAIVCSEKFGKPENERCNLTPATNRQTQVSILDRGTRRALGLIATSGMPLTIDHYKSPFCGH